MADPGPSTGKAPSPEPATAAAAAESTSPENIVLHVDDEPGLNDTDSAIGEVGAPPIAA